MIIQSNALHLGIFLPPTRIRSIEAIIIMGAYQAIKSIVRSRFNSSTSADLRAYPETRSALLGGAVFGLVALSRLPTDLRFCRSAGLPGRKPLRRFWRLAGPRAERLPVPSRQAGEWLRSGR